MHGAELQTWLMYVVWSCYVVAVVQDEDAPYVFVHEIPSCSVAEEQLLRRPVLLRSSSHVNSVVHMQCTRSRTNQSTTALS